jgi:hypothetical protein
MRAQEAHARARDEARAVGAQASRQCEEVVAACDVQIAELRELVSRAEAGAVSADRQARAELASLRAQLQEAGARQEGACTEAGELRHQLQQLDSQTAAQVRCRLARHDPTGCCCVSLSSSICGVR